MKSEDSEKLLHTISGLFPHVALLNYEMINPDDQFGRVMIENLEERGCSLQGIRECPTTKAQEDRLLRVLKLHTNEGAECEAESVGMAAVYNERLNGENERTRIEKLEMFDEFEEWTMLQNHYCLTLGKRLPSA